MTTIELSEQWKDCPALGARTNALLREDRLILNECARLSNAGELDDPEGLAEFRDLIGQSIDVERKYAAARWAEFAEIQRKWMEVSPR